MAAAALSSVEGPLFAGFEIQPAARTLLKDGREVELGARAFDLLVALAERRDRVVSRHEILDLVWPGVFVEENNIAVQVSLLRKLLGNEVVKTIPGHGYRFTAPARPGAAAAAAVTAAAAPTPARPARTPTNLPSVLPPLRGRAGDLALLGECLDAHPLVTIVGAGGIGKTLLAQHLLAARQGGFAHGVCWVELAGVSDAATLPGTVAQALGLNPGAHDPLAGLAAAVAPLSMLVALDNAEHLLDGVASLCEALLAAAPGLRLLVTSQASLRTKSEQVLRLPPLAVPAELMPASRAGSYSAVELFVERARAADARFALSDLNVPAVIELCRALDGLPLAIELAAARAPALSLQRLAASMGERLRLLGGGDRQAPERQRTLRAALEWSHSLLDDRERTVFTRLAVFSGGFSLELAQQVAADEAGGLDRWEVVDALTLLIDRSLVAVQDESDDAAAPPRYRLPESARLYACERLAALPAADAEALRRRHADAVAQLFDAHWAAHSDGSVALEAWWRRVHADAGNAHDAVEWLLARDQHDAAATIAATWLMAMPLALNRERRALAARCEAMLERVASPERAWRGWTAVTKVLTLVSRSQGLVAAERALALARQIDRPDGDRWPLAWALSGWIGQPRPGGDSDDAASRAAAAELIALSDPAWPPQRLYWPAQALAQLEQRSADPARRADAMRWLRQCIAHIDAAGGTAVYQLSGLIDLELLNGDPEAALRSGRALLERLNGSRHELALALARLNTAATLLVLDRPGEAEPLLRDGWAQAPRFDLEPYFADHLALWAAQSGRAAAAACIVGHADAANARRSHGRQPNEAAAVERARALAQTTLGEGEAGRLAAEGAVLSHARITALAFG